MTNSAPNFREIVVKLVFKTITALGDETEKFTKRVVDFFSVE